MKRIILALLVVALVSLTASSTCLAYITGPHWTTGANLKTMNLTVSQ